MAAKKAMPAAYCPLRLSTGDDYQLDAAGQTVLIAADDVVGAPVGSVHGVLNTGAQALVFVSVVIPALSDFEPL